MPYVDPQSVHNPATGGVAPAAWGDTVRDNDEFFIDKPACSISDPGVTVPDNTLTVLGTSATENFDNDNMHSVVSNRSRITIQTPGRYLFLATVSTDTFTGGPNAFIRCSLRLNGTTSFGGMQLKNVAISSQIRIQATRALVLAANDYIECTMQHTLGGSISGILDELYARFLTR